MCLSKSEPDATGERMASGSATVVSLGKGVPAFGCLLWFTETQGVAERARFSVVEAVSGENRHVETVPGTVSRYTLMYRSLLSIGSNVDFQ